MGRKSVISNLSVAGNGAGGLKLKPGQMDDSVEAYSRLGLYSTASFFAEAQYGGPGCPEDEILKLARLSLKAKDVKYTLYLIERLDRRPLKPEFRLIAGQCYLHDKDYDQCLSSVLEESPQDEISAEKSISSGICVIRASALEALENTSSAANWYKEAVKRDYRCVQAFERLVTAALINQEDALSLIKQLDIQQNDAWIQSYYVCFSVASDPSKSDMFEENLRILRDNCGHSGGPWLRYLTARHAFAQHKYRSCMKMTSDAIHLVERGEHWILLHLAATFEASGSDLFSVSHRLEDQFPQTKISFLAIGYYYLQNKQEDKAKRYLQKATAFDPQFGPAWIALGHVLSVQDDSDGALAAYRTAARLMPASHLPLIYSGMEYARLNLISHAIKYLSMAREIAAWDPTPLYELGVLSYQAGDLETAGTYFHKALEELKPCAEDEDLLVATYLGLGHVLRRQRSYSKAREMYLNAQALNPTCQTTTAALAMTYHGEGNVSKAVVFYHQSLRGKLNMTTTVQMLVESALKEVNLLPLEA